MISAQNKWLKFSLINILIVATLGVIMRYKIRFELPFFDQHNIQHAHSHFAFSGWITHTIYVLMLLSISKLLPQSAFKKYRPLIILNLLCAYGALFAFFTQGYAVLSISISLLNIFINYVFAYVFMKELKPISQYPSVKWFRAALWFHIFSSLGTYTLAYMMVNKQVLQSIYLGSVYFYLHFQYNGWFFFACMGILIGKLFELNPGITDNKTIFRMFLLSCVPAYLLSALWLDLPLWLFFIVVSAALTQFLAWLKMLKYLRINFIAIKDKIQVWSIYIFILVSLAVTIKFTLQLVSVIPSVSELAFGFRPIVIAYLHLVLLAMISLFLLNYMISFGYLNHNKVSKYAMILFVAGVFLNELALGIQGIAALSYIMIPLINEALLICAVLMFIALVILLTSQVQSVPAS